MKRTFSILIALLFALVSLEAQNREAPDMKRILALMDERSSFPKVDFSAVVKLSSDDPEKGHSEEKIALFRRDSMDAFLMLTLEPQSRKGQGSLLVDDNLWQYDPVSRKFTHTSLKDNYGASSAKNSDFRKSTTSKEYEVTGYTKGKLGAFECWIVELKAIREDTTYPFVKMWISTDTYLELKSEEYSLTKRLLRTALYPAYSLVGDSYIATRSIFQDALIKGKKTEMTITDISIRPLADEMFTKSWLEKVGR